MRESPLSNIPDLDAGGASRGVLLNVDIDGEMRVDVTHLVLVALGDTGDQVLDKRLDGPESSDRLADTMVKLNEDRGRSPGVEGDGKVLEVLGEDSARSGDSDETRLDDDRDWIREVPSAPKFDHSR